MKYSLIGSLLLTIILAFALNATPPPPTHPMGAQCDPLGPPEVCYVTVDKLRALEGTQHAPITIDWQKQQSIYITHSKAFVLKVEPLDGGPQAFYRAFSGTQTSATSISTGPPRKEAGGHSYKLLFTVDGETVDPHIVVVPPCDC
jgi:hypothetical protein